MKFLIIEGDLITNLIEADEDFVPDSGIKIPADQFPGAQIGGSIVDGVLTPAPAPQETPEETIVRIMTDADELYSQQSLADQAAFAPLYVAAKDFLYHGKFDVAKAMIQNATVPPELEAVRDQLAALLP